MDFPADISTLNMWEGNTRYATRILSCSGFQPCGVFYVPVPFCSVWFHVETHDKLVLRAHEGVFVGRSPPTVAGLRKAEDLVQLQVIPGRGKDGHVSYETLRVNTRKMLDAGGLSTSQKATHLARAEGARFADMAGVDESHVRRAGHWQADALTRSCLTNLPRPFLRALAGFKQGSLVRATNQLAVGFPSISSRPI